MPLLLPILCMIMSRRICNLHVVSTDRFRLNLADLADDDTDAVADVHADEMDMRGVDEVGAENSRRG